MSEAPELESMLNTLRDERTALLELSKPLRDRKDAINEVLQPLEAELREVNKSIRDIEQPRLSELDNQIGKLAIALGGLAMNSPAT